MLINTENMHNIKKRNGDVVPFNSKKISDAIYKANLESVDETFSANQLAAITAEVVENISVEEIPSVEFIQDSVEKVLIKNVVNVEKYFM